MKYNEISMKYHIVICRDHEGIMRGHVALCSKYKYIQAKGKLNANWSWKDTWSLDSYQKSSKLGIPIKNMLSICPDMSWLSGKKPVRELLGSMGIHPYGPTWLCLATEWPLMRYWWDPMKNMKKFWILWNINSESYESSFWWSRLIHLIRSMDAIAVNAVDAVTWP